MVYRYYEHCYNNDSCSLGNPGSGGYGAILMYGIQNTPYL